MRFIRSVVAAAVIVATGVSGSAVFAAGTADTHAAVAVGAQYDTTHVYVAPEDFSPLRHERGCHVRRHDVERRRVHPSRPRPVLTMSQLVLTPVGTLSVFGFKTPVPYPFGAERTGYLVTDMDKDVAAARAAGADVIVSTFPDPIGRDAIVQWPGGVNMQLYWHNTPPNYPKLATVPENRVYVSAERANAFVKDFVAFSHGKVVSDAAHAPGVEIGRPSDTYRRVRIESGFGKVTVLVTDGHLPYPYGHEVTGYEVADLDATLARAKAAGVTVLVPPYNADGREGPQLCNSQADISRKCTRWPLIETRTRRGAVRRPQTAILKETSDETRRHRARRGRRLRRHAGLRRAVRALHRARDRQLRAAWRGARRFRAGRAAETARVSRICARCPGEPRSGADTAHE